MNKRVGNYLTYFRNGTETKYKRTLNIKMRKLLT